MAMNTEEFVNPKSMITPGFLAAAVATVAGALFSMFAVALPASLIILSFFFGAVVFHSREFADAAMKRWGKAFFYVLNSLIIFAMATGTHSVLDPGKRAAATGTGFSIVRTAYAQAGQGSTPALKQERPFFYDWTKLAAVPHTPVTDKGIIKVQSQKDFGSVRNFFVNASLATPDYKVQIEVDGSKLPAGVKSVTWRVPAAYFAKDRVTATNEAENFAVSIDAWKPFAVSAEIELKSGEKIRVDKFISFDAKKN